MPYLKPMGNYADRHYRVLPYPEMIDFIIIWKKALREHNIKYSSKKFDCDDFAQGFGFMLSYFASKIGNGGTFVCYEVRGNFHWADGYHQANLIYTGMNWVFVEPQTGEQFPVTDKDKINFRYL